MAGKLEFLEKRRACFEVGLGLSALHQCGIVHSDVKCENVIMFQDENGVYTAKIADFGCSTSENPDGARLGGGTPPWTAPEWKKWIRQGHLTKTDIYSFGLLVWRVMAGGTDPLSEVFASEHTQHTDNKEDTIAMFEKAKQEERLLVLLEDHCSRVLRGHCSELPKQVLRATVLLEPDMRNLANALDVLRIPDAYSEVAK
jgi:serine/threonine protein kinase